MIAKPMLALALAATVPPGVAAAQAPPGPPGPPPGNGTDLPAAPGTLQGLVPPGMPAAIPDANSPGLLSGGAVVLDRKRRTFSLRLACQSHGRVRVRSARVTSSDLARTRYRCANGRANARMSVSRTIAKRLKRRRMVAATGIVRQSGRDARVYFDLSAGRSVQSPTGFWTDGHLQCSPGYLVEPDFTTASPTPISTRGWIAWYTASSGWHWLGSGGESAGSWNNWTSSATGVTQFHPGGAAIPVPWTLGPVAIPAGRAIYATGVFEIVYWVAGRPEYQWQYVNAGTTGAVAAGASTPYCAYA